MTTQEQVKDVVSQVLADKADKGGIKRVVWIGAGGSNGGNYPAQYFMEHEATQVVSSSYTSNEFVHATPAYVNENTLAVVVSMRGTKETIVAAQVAKDHGASTIAIYVDESGLTEVCDYKIQYDSLAVDESCMGRTNSAVVTMIAMELTQQTEAMPSTSRYGRLRLGRPHLSQGCRVHPSARCQVGRAERRQALHQRYGSGPALWCRLRL